MKKFTEIIQKRSRPGILIFDMDERLLYSNSEAFDIMPFLGKNETETGADSCLPKEVLDLCRITKKSLADRSSPASLDPRCVVMNRGMGKPCSLRSFCIGLHGNNKNPTHIMVLVEKIVEKREPDFDKARIKYDLSKKELEVLKLVSQGFSNQAIGDELFICLYTVKDHIKHLKRKMNASSRSEMISLLK